MTTFAHSNRSFLVAIPLSLFIAITIGACASGERTPRGERTPSFSPSFSPSNIIGNSLSLDLDAGSQESARYSSIDSVLRELTTGSIAFNSPQHMNIEETGTIQLKLGLNKEIENLKKLIDSEGAKLGFNIKVADLMEARLTGQGFSITAITPEVQAISRNEITDWSWEVKPKLKGKQHLHLTLTALIRVNGASVPRTLRTFNRVVNVEVTQGQQLETFASQNWQWLWATFLVPIAGWIWKCKSGRK